MLLADYDQHILQLLRTLNLNSPTPCTQPTSLSHPVDLSPSSPDLSPISTTSPLLTPTDLSPARSFDIKFNAPYDLRRPASHLSQSSLLLEPNSPTKMQEFSSNFSQYRPPYATSYQNAQANNHGQFIDKSSDHAFLYAAQSTRRGDTTRGSSLAWRGSQQLSSEWSRHGEPRFMDHNGLSASEDLPRYPFAAHHPIQTNNSVQSHEVWIFLLTYWHVALIRHLSANQLPVAFATVLFPSLSCIRGAYHQVF
jgi:pumilio RNA-binding family